MTQPDAVPTDKQLEVYEYVLNQVCENGYQPSYGEIAAHFGVTRTAIVSRLKELEQKGIIRLQEDRAIILPFVYFCVQYSENKA